MWAARCASIITAPKAVRSKSKSSTANSRFGPRTDWATVALGDLTGVAHDIKLNVAAGDVVRFVLDKGTVPEHDLIAWMPRIVYDEHDSRRNRRRLSCVSSAGPRRPTPTVAATFGRPISISPPANPSRRPRRSKTLRPRRKISALYQNGRAGKDFSYSIPVPAGLYALRLKFAEPKHPWMFERPINVDINGQQVLTDFDIVQAAKGPRRAVERTFRNVVPNADSKIVLRFAAGKHPQGTSDDAIVQAIEVLARAEASYSDQCRQRCLSSSTGTVAFGWRTPIFRAERPSNPPCMSLMRRRRCTTRSCTARPGRQERSATRLPHRRACTQCI